MRKGGWECPLNWRESGNLLTGRHREVADRPHLIDPHHDDSDPHGSPAIPFATLSPPVLFALRAVRRVRDEHIRALTSRQRRELAAAERLTAQYIDLQAQIDASAESAGE